MRLFILLPSHIGTSGKITFFNTGGRPDKTIAALLGTKTSTPFSFESEPKPMPLNGCDYPYSISNLKNYSNA